MSSSYSEAFISAFGLVVITLTTLLSASQADARIASSAVTPPSHAGPHSVRLPAVDGNDIRFSRLSTAQGLSQTRVLQLIEDDQGFMWFGTQYGLNRYDGYEFRVFTHDPAREDSLSCVYIHSLFEDRSGALWVGCDHFLDKFDRVTETVTHYRLEAEAPGEVANAVEQISQDRACCGWQRGRVCLV